MGCGALHPRGAAAQQGWATLAGDPWQSVRDVFCINVVYSMCDIWICSKTTHFSRKEIPKGHMKELNRLGGMVPLNIHPKGWFLKVLSLNEIGFFAHALKTC